MKVFDLPDVIKINVTKIDHLNMINYNYNVTFDKVKILKSLKYI